MQSINPANAELIRSYTPENISAVNSKLTALQKTFLTWKGISLDQRISVISQIADILRNNKIEYAQLITTEMGKIRKEAIAEVEKCATACTYYAENAAAFLAPTEIKTESVKSLVVYSPLGIILGIMPWNFPFWQVIRFAIPTLLAGNVVLLKHASCVPGCALALEEIFNSASKKLNLEVFKTILFDSKQMDEVINAQLIQAVSLTGSVDAGKHVASIAGGQIKKTVLELGGSDPYIVLADADITQAAKICAKARLMNCGQSCIAAKRFIVVAAVYEQFINAFTEQFSNLKIGDPIDDATNIGPLATKQILETVAAQVEQSIAAGAKCILGGKQEPRAGYYFQPTILTDIPEHAPAACEEIFGPVASVFKVANEAEAIALANATQFGLGAAIFSQNTAHALELAKNSIQAGNVFINSNVSSDPRMPFGGVKQSGYGRELSEFGIHEFVNIKTIRID